MTAYFDAKRREIDDLDTALRALTADSPGWDAFFTARDAFDRAIVWDVTIAAESPGFPADMRDAIHTTVIAYSVACTTRGADVPDYADESAHNYGLRMMAERLHDIFHALGRLRLEGYSDDPRSWLREVHGRGEERREQLAAMRATS